MNVVIVVISILQRIETMKTIIAKTFCLECNKKFKVFAFYAVFQSRNEVNFNLDFREQALHKKQIKENF